LPSSEDDEENEEIMRANANINNMQQTSNSNGNGNGNNAQKPSGSNPTKSAADNWKGIGNRHMASQEYEEAYKAYSASLSISPLGPSSHIYLSNRAAALLSLKRYSAASVDARRAITLAPTFGKAHARLGQSLYFLKDYAGAVAAYENAFQFEPENQVTWTYLNKAKKKFKRENERKRRKEEAEIDALNGKRVGSGDGQGH
jgi:tetratricopeptide (TPR) repeat protein